MTDSKWTIETLKAHFDALRVDDQRAIAAAMSAANEARIEAKSASEKRFDSVNEFRGTLVDQADTFARKAEVDIQIKSLEEKMVAVAAARSAGMYAVWGVLVAVFMGAIGVAAIMFK